MNNRLQEIKIKSGTKSVQISLIALVLILQLYHPGYSQEAKWKLQASRVEIIRDEYGIPHIYGKSDADAVFGLLYAQCEDDFNRVEMNYIEKLGRLAELNEKDLYNDLYTRLIIDSTEAINDLNNSPGWLKLLLQAFADGVNYYLQTHPEVKPKLLTHFQPWYPLLWTDGSIGAINTADINEADVQRFYSTEPYVGFYAPPNEKEYTGSNGLAIAPMKSENGHAMLYINPHVTFYFRPEVHMVSEEGLNAYGAVTWGQFFIYQGFNAHCGWMHTSCNVDVADVYKEKIINEKDKKFYLYDDKPKSLGQKLIQLNYKQNNKIESKTFRTYFTHHGPIMGIREGKWVSVRSNNRSLNGLKQSWLRTKVTSFNGYKQIMNLKSNISNNTVYADAQGHIAYWHGNFIPKRSPALDWSKPVDGHISKTEWQGLHEVNESVHIYDPSNGWIQNCNSTPFTAAGSNSPKKFDYPSYMAPDGENFRGINAVRVLQSRGKLNLDQFISAGYDTYLSAFEVLIPALLQAYSSLSATEQQKYSLLKEPIHVLQQWDYRVSTASIATTLAIEWAEHLNNTIQKVYIDEGEDDQVSRTKTFAFKASPDQLLLPLTSTIRALDSMYGTWQKPWGDINRFQRLSSDIQQKPNEDKTSIAVPFASASWGMLPAYNSRRFPGTINRYGVGGNSFICAVEFGPRIKAKSLLAGGESGNPSSAHFFDQAQMYTMGKFKDVLFYKEDVMKHVMKKYKPGE
ncbi:MAG: penicillin acylase family protein [Saprospiraceae bacterium]